MNFEEWFANEVAKKDCALGENLGDDMELAWNESRKQALEDAAKLCETKVTRDAEYGGRFGGYGGFQGDKTGTECAELIRKLP